MFPLLSKNVPKREAQKEALRIAELLGLTHALKYRSKDLDMGARQRVTLGRALVRKPSAFLMDEPLSSIEPEGKWHLKMQIREIQETLDQTLIYVTHDQSEALTLADKIAVMHKGEFLQYASREEIYDNPSNTFVGYFIGDPGMNFVDCVLKNGSLAWDDFRYAASPSLGKDGTEFVIGIRPEHVQANKSEQKDWIPAKLTSVEHLGNMVILHILARKHTIKAKLETWDAPAGAVWIHFPKDKIKLFKKTGELVGA